MAKMEQQRSMTEGSVLRHILSFAIPMMLSSIFQNLYNLADISIAGHTLGDGGIASIAATSALFSVIHNIALGFNSGNAIIVSRTFGSGDRERTRKAYAMMLELAVAFSLVVTVVLFLLLKPLLSLCNVPQELYSDAKAYIGLIIGGLLVMMLYNMYASLLRSVGDSRTPLIFLIISSAINVGLDLLFMRVLGLGVRGAAYATVLAQGISVALCIIHVARSYPYLKISAKEFLPDFAMMREMFGMGLSISFANSLYAFGDLAMQRTVNGFGASYITAYAAGTKLTAISFMPSVALAFAVSTFAAQNSGAGRFERIGKGIRTAFLCALAMNVLTFTITYLFGSVLVGALTGSSDPTVVENGTRYMRIVVPFTFMQNVVMSFRMSIQGMGYKLIPTFATAIELFCRCFSAWALAGVLGFTGVCFGNPMSWVLSGLFVMICFFPLRRKAQARYQREHPESVIGAEIA